MVAELRELTGHLYVVDVECGLEEDWAEDRAGAALRLDEHNAARHPPVAAGSVDAVRAPDADPEV